MMPYGNVDFSHALRFQLQILFGDDFRYLEDKNANQDDLVYACLRRAWGPAFQHVSRNTSDFNGLSEKKKREEIDTACRALIDPFLEYARLKNSALRAAYIENFVQNTLVFNGIKSSVTFGNIQKLFNMAMKYYLTITLCADAPNSFVSKSKLYQNFAFDTADCPIDDKILSKLGKSSIKWSQMTCQEYIGLQTEIAKRLNGKKSNLCFDFENW